MIIMAKNLNGIKINEKINGGCSMVDQFSAYSNLYNSYICILFRVRSEVRC